MQKWLENRKLYWGIFLVLLGTLLLMDQFSMVNITAFLSDWWPVLLIAFGVKTIFFPGKSKSNTFQFKRFSHYNYAESVRSDGKANVIESKIFGDIVHQIRSKKFAGGSFSTFAGDIEIDASEMHIAEGQWTLNLDGIFGDIRVRLPRNCAVMVQAQIALGSIFLLGQETEGFFAQRSYKSADFDKAPARIIIAASVTFGDIKIWNDPVLIDAEEFQPVAA